MILEPNLVSPAVARAYCDGVLAESGHERCDEARLVVSELVTNAVVHAGTTIELDVVVREDVLRIEVTDCGADRPHVWTEGDTSGRGLPIVEAIGDAWGVLDLGSAKTVWCELSL